MCTACGSEFRRSHDLKRHQKLHTGEKPFACANCGRRFARADALGRHAKSSGEGGCVNSRKTSGELNSAPQGSNYQLPSPVAAYDRNDQFAATSAGGGYPRKGSAGSLAGSDRHAHSPRGLGIQQVQHDRDSAYVAFDSRGSYEPTDRPTYEYSAPKSEMHNGRARSSEPHPILPPLQTGFPYEHDRQSLNLLGPSDTYLSKSSFGLSPVFDGSRPPAAHPLSYDRGAVPESAPARAQSSGASFAKPTTVPISQFQQLEARHREVEERLRQLESHSNVPRAGQEGLSSTREEDRRTASSSSS